jgi:excisionase family DNA binding protein
VGKNYWSDAADDAAEWIGMVEAARLLGLHRSTLHLAIQQRQIQPDRYTPGGHVRFRRATLEAFRARLADAPAAGGMSARIRELGSMARRLTLARDSAAICQTALDCICQAERNVDMCYIALHRPSERDPLGLQPVASWALPEGFFAFYERLRPSYDFTTTAVLASGEPRIYADTTEDRLPRGSSLLVRWTKTRSYAVLPILGRDRPIGVIVVLSRAPHTFGPSELLFLTGVAAQLSVALVSVRQLARWQTALRGAQQLTGRMFRSPTGGTPPSALVDLAAAYRMASSACGVCTLGLADDLRMAGPRALQLAQRARETGHPQRAVWRQGRGATTGLAACIPQADGPDGAVAATWQGLREHCEADQVLLVIFGEACAALSSHAGDEPAGPGADVECGVDHDVHHGRA